jgi:hypothetical protein
VGFFYSHLILKSKFSMKQAQHRQKGGTSVYQLSNLTLQGIKCVLRSKQQLEDLESGFEVEVTDSASEAESSDSDVEVESTDSETE